MSNVYELSIREMAVKFNVSLRTLRFYESKGLLSPTRVGIVRFYGEKDQVRLELIIKGKQLGFTLSEVSDLIGSASQANPPSLPLNKKQIEIHIASLSKKREAIELSLNELRGGLERQKA